MSKGNIPHAILLSLGVFFFFFLHVLKFLYLLANYTTFEIQKSTQKKNKILDYSQFAAFFSTQTEHS